MDNKPTKREMRDMSRDVTEPLPGMLDPISQAYKDRMDSRMQEADKKQDDKSMGPMKIAPKIMAPKKKPDGMKKGGKVSSASKRADGCAIRGKTRGKMV
jgi:hypothetical protein